jgi:hypothetical protein
MFRTAAPVAEPDPHDDVIPADEQLIPLSVLALDLGEPPVGGWNAYLAGKGIEFVLDHIGRSAVSAADARQLLDEKRQEEIRQREFAKRQEQKAIEADRVRRAAMPKGLHWTEIPDGVSVAEMWAQAEKDARPKRRSPLEAALAGEGIVYHPIREDEAS